MSKIFKIVISISLSFSLLFLLPLTVKAMDSSDNPLEIIIEPSDKSFSSDPEDLTEETNKGISSEYPDLGDDQVFPFIAGLGSNSHL